MSYRSSGCQEMISRVYISHDPEDGELAKRLAEAIGRVGLESFMATSRSVEGIGRAELAAFGIRNSECFIPLITLNGCVSRTVNQEIGYARGLDHLIVPLMEEGTDTPFMIDHIQPITFRSDGYEDAIAVLIRTIRRLTRLEWLKVSCPLCGEEMTQYLTPQEVVDRAIEDGTPLETICSYCESTISLDPRTFCPLP